MVHIPDANAQPPEYHNVLIIGAGVTGLAMGAQLRMMLGETDVRIIERSKGIGGTWEQNTYPGAGCDIPIVLYSFSFAQKKDWPEFWPPQHVIRDYLEKVSDRFDLTRRTVVNTEVSSAHWDDELGMWHVYTRPAKGQDTQGGEDKHWICRVLISGVGGLSQPNPCNIPGHEKFQGPLFHSARWDHSVQTKDKHVVVVGNGCSATQFIPMLANDGAKSITQAVRSKHWYAKRPNDPTDSAVMKWLLRNVPGFYLLVRAIVHIVLELSSIMMYRHWAGTQARERFARNCISYIKQAAPTKYHDILVPQPEKDGLHPGCKRRVFDTDYLPTLHRDNVELESSPLVEIKEKSVLTKDGRELPADVIVLANGFAVTNMGFPMKIYGKTGKTVQDYWAEAGGPGCYRGSMMSEFPNFALAMGPNTGTGHFSYIFTSECSTRFAIEIFKPIIQAPRPTVFNAKAPGAKKQPSVCVRPEKEEQEQCWIQKQSRSMVYTFDCGSWYVDKESGRVAAVYPQTQTQFWIRASNPIYSDFDYKGIKAPRTWFTGIRETIGWGGIPKQTPEDLKKFRSGEWAVGKPKGKEI
ncbi:FAD/NAD(P)-binding domain-containing protein [Ceraceosorus guamensis]|uniref:FAD/NAD(P)-binding domain-containing protein n=1 Tax=Ceraceosorus guamensis TaxID=1522189 RepID=A0A316WBM9_9BASI|nr:FAD/NAD(P)-binding domain-containing protein [Ceraceosorus guamensis]PWN46061.1 FAD/NAD(P)-binding domain-containing protein [Ceraceosorus guamensis]